mmetsp:Transcript_52960/g.97987  ORF Transcript_52960/g.97987 Transcript_52960/m.97987 type:complete len:278 (-) Transcript_52960:466-1299(-)
MAVQLNERQHACACDAAWWWCGWWSAAECDGDLILLGQDTLWWRLVKLWVVELMEPVLCNADELLGCGVRCHQLSESLMLFLAVLSGCCNLLVQGLDTSSQGFDLLCQAAKHALSLLNGQVQVLDLLLHSFLVVIRGVELLQAILLLVVIILLFLGQGLYQLVDELEDLVKVDLLTSQGQGEQVKTRLLQGRCLSPGSHHHLEGLLLNSLACSRDLHQAWAWQCLLEQLQSIIVVQDFDGFRQGQLFLSTHLFDLFPLLVLGVTVSIQIRQELLILT